MQWFGCVLHSSENFTEREKGGRDREVSDGETREGGRERRWREGERKREKKREERSEGWRNKEGRKEHFPGTAKVKKGCVLESSAAER